MNNNRILIHTEYITLSQFLKFCGAASTGGEAGEWIRDGIVQVDGEVCTARGKKLYGGETVTVFDEQYQVVRS